LNISDLNSDLTHVTLSALVEDITPRSSGRIISKSGQSNVNAASNNTRKFDMSSELDIRLYDKVKYSLSALASSKSKQIKQNTSFSNSLDSPEYTTNISTNDHERTNTQNNSVLSTQLISGSDIYTLHLERELHKKSLDIVNLQHVVSEQKALLEAQENHKRPEAELLREAAVMLDKTEQKRLKLANSAKQSVVDLKALEDKLAAVNAENGEHFFSDFTRI
jgi:hypothetical protein